MNKKINYLLFFVFGLVLLGASFFYSGNQQITGYVISNPSGVDSGDNLYCKDADLSKLSSSTISNCGEPYIEQGTSYSKLDLVKKALQKNGLWNYDPLLVLAQFYQESGCNHNQPNKQGIGQVVSCAREGGCNIEENIERAVSEHIAPLYNKVQSSGINLKPDEKVRLVLFGYNRGSGSLDTALDNIKEGMALNIAMLNSCYQHFPNGCGGFSKEKCCQIGLDYGPKVLSLYKSTCAQVGGQLSYDFVPVETGESLVEVPEEGSGTYELSPSFRLESDYNLEGYELVIKQVKLFAEQMDECAQKEYKDKGEIETRTIGTNIEVKVKKQVSDLNKCVLKELPLGWEKDCEGLDTMQDNTFMFCAPTDYNVKLFNKETKKVEEAMVKIKFALQFKEYERTISANCGTTVGKSRYECFDSLTECRSSGGTPTGSFVCDEATEICCRSDLECSEEGEICSSSDDCCTGLNCEFIGVIGASSISICK